MTTPPSDWPPGRTRRWLAVVTLLALPAVIAVFCHAPLLGAAARALDVSEPPGRTDAALVLGGGRETRPFVAAALLRRGLVPRVLVPENFPSPEAEDGLLPPEHELVRRILLARGVPADAVTVLPGPCASTADEARALAGYLDGQPDCRVAVVTHGYHTRRARMLFRRELGERMARVHFVGAPTDYYDADSWWRCEDGFTAYLTEAFKLVTAGLGGERSWQLAALALLALAVLAPRAARRLRRLKPPGAAPAESAAFLTPPGPPHDATASRGPP